MDQYNEEISGNYVHAEGTGNHNHHEEYKIISYPFDKYEIKVKLSPTNEFVGITEIKINKDFLSFKQRITSSDVHDIDEFYRE